MINVAAFAVDLLKVCNAHGRLQMGERMARWPPTASRGFVWRCYARALGLLELVGTLVFVSAALSARTANTSHPPASALYTVLLAQDTRSICSPLPPVSRQSRQLSGHFYSLPTDTYKIDDFRDVCGMSGMVG